MDAGEIAQLFTRPVSAAVATAQMYDAPLDPLEARAVARAIGGRRREFAAGRACARQALERLGVKPVPVPAAADRSPIWPGGVVGTISHCEGFCCAVVARSADAGGIGIDAEGAEPLSLAAERLVLRPEERARFAVAAPPAGTSWAKLAFSAKEAFYKCVHPMTKARLTFQDAAVCFGADGSFRIEARALADLASVVEGRWRMSGGLVFTAMTAPAEVLARPA